MCLRCRQGLPCQELWQESPPNQFAKNRRNSDQEHVDLDKRTLSLSVRLVLHFSDNVKYDDCLHIMSVVQLLFCVCRNVVFSHL